MDSSLRGFTKYGLNRSFRSGTPVPRLPSGVALYSPSTDRQHPLSAAFSMVETPPDQRPPSPRSFAGVLPWGLVAALAVVALWLAGLNLVSRSENESLRSEHALASVAVQTLQTQLEAERLTSSRLVSDFAAREQSAGVRQPAGQLQLSVLTTAILRPAVRDSRAVGIVVWDSRSRRGLFVAESLPATEPGQAYELWSKTDVPTRLARFTVSSEGAARALLRAEGPIAAPLRFELRRTAEEGAGRDQASAGEVILATR